MNPHQNFDLTVSTVDDSQGQYIVPHMVHRRHGSSMLRPEWNVTSKYRIKEHVGSGAYGQVARAQLTSDLSKTVVIKRTSDVFNHPSLAKRTLREIAIMRRLDHPNIVKVLDILEPEEGSPSAACDAARAVAPGSNLMFKDLYVVLEDGGVDLKTFFDLQTERLGLEQIQHIARQICAAMSYLHSCRVVHRDLKPANILIDHRRDSPTYLHVRIADFGLSRAVELPPGAPSPPPPSPSAPFRFRKSNSEADFLSQISECEFRTVFGEDGDHACVELGMQHMSLADDFQRKGGEPMYAHCFTRARRRGKHRVRHASITPSHASFALTHVPHRYAQMTAHVVTRPYRAPEAVLCAGNYSQVSISRLFCFCCVCSPRRSRLTRSPLARFRPSTFGAWDASSLNCLNCSSQKAPNLRTLAPHGRCFMAH